MPKFMIGKVISVHGDSIDIAIADPGRTKSGEAFGVADNMTVEAPVEGGGKCKVAIGNPGSFVAVENNGGDLLCIVTDIKESNNGIVLPEEMTDKNKAEPAAVLSSKRVMSVLAFGTIRNGGGFERGTDALPTVNSPVYAVTPGVIESIYKNYAEGNFALGKLSLIPDLNAMINFDSFFARHAAILGQTGGGKSWTVASVLQKIAAFPNATTVLFDLHGEYHTAFGDEAEYIDASELELPYWLMNSEELLGLMVEKTEFAAPNQVAKFKELLQAAKEQHEENLSLGIPKITIDTPVYFDFENIIDQFRTLDSEMVPGARGEKQGPMYGQFTRLLMRIDAKLNDKRYDLIFHPMKYNTSASMELLFRKILGEEKKNHKKLVIVDISPIPFDVRNSVISLIMRCLFDFAYWFKRMHGKAYPIIVFCDEAHIYLNDKESYAEPSRMAAEKIAKEGRKYGISLVVISQRPREVSSTILSQCNTFLCLRISNPDDQAYVRNLLPDSIRGIVSMFSTLKRGECILLGDSVIMPTRVKIDMPGAKPHSEDTSFYREWNRAHEEVDINRVLDAWRKQQVD